MKIGIYGGSFDPPHVEHVKIAENFIKEAGLDKLYVVPANVAPHKPYAHMISGKARLHMLDIAFASLFKAIICDYEINAGGSSYTYLTVERFRKEFPEAEIYFLMGTDMLENFPCWKNPEIILKNAKLFVTGRSGEDKNRAIKTFVDKFGSLDRVVFSEFEGEKISSTDIRNRLMLGLDVDGKLNDEVLEYIKKEGLYKGDEKAEYVRKSLPISRLTHTLGVMNLSKTYAKTLNEDENKATLAAMLHDVAKYSDPKDFKGFVLPEGVPKPVVHQFLGAFIAENILGVKDEDVLNAIRYHTTGRPNMSNLEKIVFLADLLEEGRKYSDAQELREAVKNDFEKGFLLCLRRLKDFLENSDEPVYYLSEECYDYYLKDLRHEKTHTKND